MATFQDRYPKATALSARFVMACGPIAEGEKSTDVILAMAVMVEGLLKSLAKEGDVDKLRERFKEVLDIFAEINNR
jgi:hypothetical protein